MRSMKEGKEDEKYMRPMFPRLHVNDTDKGGPRAPPRNKMSLYEQLSIPSQKFSSATPPHKLGSLVPSASSKHTHDRAAYSTFYPAVSTPATSAENPYFESFDGKSIKHRRMEFDRSTGRVQCKPYCATGSSVEGSAHGPSEKNCFKTKYDDEDDFRVPTLVHPDAGSHLEAAPLVEVNRSTILGANNAQKSTTIDSAFQETFRESIQEANISGKLSKLERVIGEQVSRDSLSGKGHGDEFPNHLAGELLASPSKTSLAPSDRGPETKMKIFNKTGYQSAIMAIESPHDGMLVAPHKSSNDSPFHKNINTYNIRSESSSGASSGFSQQSFDDKTNELEELKDTQRTCDVSEASKLYSISGFKLSPDDVVGVIGPKQFWKARRELVNQQRVFAIQVFELHRLIKVQKLFAASPRLLLDNSRIMKIQSNISIKSPQIASTLKCHSLQKPSPLAEITAGSTLQTQERNPKNNLGPPSRNIPHSSNPPPLPLPLDNSPNPWCFHPPPNQWLIPVLSPSEGLIYKPYSGPCPPNPGLMAPLYGNYGSLSMPPVAENYLPAPHIIPSSHQQQNRILPGSVAFDQNYLAMPSVNPVIASSMVEQVSPLINAHPNIHTKQLSQSSCNKSITKREALPRYPPRSVTFKDREQHASTASSPCDREQREGRDMLRLFPNAPVQWQASQICGKEHQTNVIRVVPHNARSATESAARIFRSIQEERQQFCL